MTVTFTRAAVSLVLLLSTAIAAAGGPTPTGAQQSFDHRAHAVPNPPVTLTTWAPSRVAAVVLDGSRSHSHYFAAGPPPVSGRIVSYRWSDATTGRLLSTAKNPRLEFPLGTTRLRLRVVDNTGDAASAVTSVTVQLPQLWQRRPPTLTSIDPTRLPLSGGIITVRGTGFYNQPAVRVDGVEVRPLEPPTDTVMRVRAPPHWAGTAGVVVANGFGVLPWPRRATLTYARSRSAVRFTQTYLRNARGQGAYRTPQAVVLRIGPDGAYYLGDLSGRVTRLSVTGDYRVTAACTSKALTVDGAKRSVMGMAFNPHHVADVKPRLYVTTATLFLKSRFAGGDERAWANGQVEELVADPTVRSGTCITHTRTVVSGLPVSAHDHSVSALEFNEWGALLINSGSMTNAGVSTPGDGIGGVPDSPLSSAVLIAYVNRRGFNGTVRYSDYRHPERADIVAGGASVRVYASGIRNAMSLLVHSSGALFTSDNSANQNFGFVSLSCTASGAQPPDEPDRLLRVERGRYYGSPNRNRGRFDARQCTYRSPRDAVAHDGYTPPIATFVSSTNGMAEYTAHRFANALRGDLFSSRVAFQGRGTLYHTRLDGGGTRVAAPPAVFWRASGLSLVVDAAGAMVMAQTFQRRVLLLRPRERNPGKPLVIGVHPPRGRARGGNVILVVGWRLVGRPARVGRRACVRSWRAWGSRAGEGALYCLVPPGRGRVRVTVPRGVWDEHFNYRYV